MIDKGSKGWVLGQWAGAVRALAIGAHAGPGIAAVAIAVGATIALGHDGVVAHCRCPIDVVHVVNVMLYLSCLPANTGVNKK